MLSDLADFEQIEIILKHESNNLLKKMKRLLTLLFAFAFTATVAQTANNSVSIGKVETMHSNLLKEEREIFVYVPEGSGPLFATKHYPVVYLFDGDAHFHSVTGMIQQLSQVNGNSVLPEMIVVGITNTDRMRDLTPSHDTEGSGSDRVRDKTSGGGEVFTAFIEKELIPHIDSLYPTAPYRVLIGHSLGGLMVVNTLFNHTNLFNSYIAIDPSMWWDERKLLKQAEKDLAGKNFDHKTLFLAMANTMEPTMDTASVRRDTSFSTEHIRSIIEFTDGLKQNKTNQLNWSSKYYNEDDHGSVPLMAAYDGLRFIFSFNKFRMPSSDKEFLTFNFVSAIISHFKEVSKQMGYTVLPSEMLVNDLAYQLLQKKYFDQALRLFEMNIANYPTSLNVYDSMGDLYDAKGDKQQAMAYFAKALTFGDSPITKAKLEKLKAEK